MVQENVGVRRRGGLMQNETRAKTPVALFTYNRPDHTRKVLESLSRCRRLDECSVFIYCDGPKSPAHADGVKASRSIVRTFAETFPATVVLRETNLGLARSIVTGVTELCTRYGRVIVIEDDFILSPSFLDYMLQSLDRYEDNGNIYQISGFMFPVDNPEQPDAFLLPLTTSWGWATWKRAWAVFDWNASGWQELLSDSQKREQFNLDNSYPYYEMLRGRFSGKNDSWAILWWYAVFRANGLVLHPKRSLVWVGGFDDSGTHCGRTNMVLRSVSDLWKFPENERLAFPKENTGDDETFTRIRDYLRMQNTHSFAERLFRIFKSMKNSILSWWPV